MADNLPPFALSVRQPWAWAVIHAGKDVENRVKRAITMGQMDKHASLAIHASSGMTRAEYEVAAEFMASIGVTCPRPNELIRGGIIGSVNVTGVVKESESPWFFGPWALTVSDPRFCDSIPCRGQLGCFQWEPERIDDLREPLQWMLSWPEQPRRNAQQPSEPLPSLFDGTP